MLAAAPAYAVAQTYLFDVPQLSADGALTELANQADISVVFDFESVSKYQTKRLTGEYSISEAIELLLGDTPLTFQLHGDHLIVTQKTTINEIDNMETSKKNTLLTGIVSFFIGSGVATNSVAQDQSNNQDTSPVSVTSLEEIIVTGRNREESLQDVPVSTSVLGESLLEDAGISNLYDLYEMVPGLHYDEQTDRIGALPSIRGVQSNELAPNRTKVTSFIDGMPVLGSAGTIGFNGFQQVEVYRGPQSAAFGRSTFGGAINYITKDPGDAFEASFGINVSDFGTRILNGSIGSPITDSLGVLVQFQHENSSSPSEWHANGNSRENQDIGTNLSMSDGTEFGARSGDNISAKFVFEPSDEFRAALTFAHTETADARNPILYPTETARNNCFNDQGLRANQGMASIWINGTMNCDWDDFRETYANHDPETYLRNNQVFLDYLESEALANGAAPMDVNGQNLSVEEQILMVARAYSYPESARGTQSDRDRITLQLERTFGNGGALEFSFMNTEETYTRINDGSGIYFDPDNFGIVEDGEPFPAAQGIYIGWEDDGTWSHRGGMGPTRAIMANAAEIEENYAEVRWVSPGEDRLRYVVGASYYDYDFLEEEYAPNGSQIETVGYGALVNGIIPEFEQLTGLTFAPDSAVISESATNTSVYFNVGYDLSDKITLSAEGRYQSDEVGARNNETGLSADETTKSFIPRLAVNYSVNDDTSLYFQWSRGVNPAGINVGMLDEAVIASIDTGINNAFIPFEAAFDVDSDADGFIDDYDLDTDQFSSLTGASYNVSYDSTTFRSYDEETLTNIEFGFKGNLLDGDLTYSGAIYMIDWKDQLQNGAIDWDSPCADGDLSGLHSDAAGYLGNCSYEGQEYFYVRDTDDTSVANVGINYGDVKINGVELETSYRISDNWNLRSTAAYLNAEYDSYCDIALYALRLDANPTYAEDLNIRVLDPGSDAEVSSECYIADGNEVSSQPQLTASLSPSFNTEFAGLGFNARLDVRYVDKRWRDSGNFTAYSATTTANLAFTLSDDSWDATLYVNNLTDENTPQYVTSAGDLAYNLGQISDTPVRDYAGTEYNIVRDNFQFTPRPPRTLGLRANYYF